MNNCNASLKDIHAFQTYVRKCCQTAYLTICTVLLWPWPLTSNLIGSCLSRIVVDLVKFQNRFIRHRVNKLEMYDHRCMHGHMDSWKAECLGHYSNGGRGTKTFACLYRLSARSVLLPTSMIMTSGPRSARTSSIHFDVCWNELASKRQRTSNTIKVQWVQIHINVLSV